MTPVCGDFNALETSTLVLVIASLSLSRLLDGLFNFLFTFSGSTNQVWLANCPVLPIFFLRQKNLIQLMNVNALYGSVINNYITECSFLPATLCVQNFFSRVVQWTVVCIFESRHL